MRTNNLTEGKISKALLTLALPIMGTAFVQMAYNLTDVFWVGRLGSLATAAVGTGGFFTWLSMSLTFVSKLGAEVKVAQSVGKKDEQAIKSYVRSGIQLCVSMGLIYGLLLIFLRQPIVAFFNLRDGQVVAMAEEYIRIVGTGMLFTFMNQMFTSLWNGYGSSRAPFAINCIGLSVNMLLDPLLIHGYLGFPKLGVAGAAIATVFAQFIVFCVFLMLTRRNPVLFSDLHLLRRFDREKMAEIVRIGFPAGFQNGLFAFFAMVISRIIADWGAVAVAVQRTGAQIEAISWMTASGFNTAIGAFTGQNFGAGRWERIKKGYLIGLGMVSIVGIVSSLLFLFWGGEIFAKFLPEEEAVRLGTSYLRILGYSQLFMCIEILTSGGFNGFGKTLPPSFVSIFFNALRIPLALLLSSTALDLNGVWWSVTLTSICKGILLTAWFCYLLFLKKDHLSK
ncbi:MAG: MATE family efflux transporter [Peptostreptococcaceae bacterium]|nr:MATE family efflux transporter [Peptostreptococcaceae bacterium]